MGVPVELLAFELVTLEVPAFELVTLVAPSDPLATPLPSAGVVGSLELHAAALTASPRRIAAAVRGTVPSASRRGLPQLGQDASVDRTWQVQAAQGTRKGAMGGMIASDRPNRQVQCLR